MFFGVSVFAFQFILQAVNSTLFSYMPKTSPLFSVPMDKVASRWTLIKNMHIHNRFSVYLPSWQELVWSCVLFFGCLSELDNHSCRNSCVGSPWKTSKKRRKEEILFRLRKILCSKCELRRRISVVRKYKSIWYKIICLIFSLFQSNFKNWPIALEV